MRDPKIPRYLRKYWKWKYATLLLVLLDYYIVMPFVGVDSTNSPTFVMAELGVMLCCVLATARSKPIMAAAVFLTIAAEFSSDSRSAFHLMFFGLILWVVLGDVLRGRAVTTDKILGALCGFLLLGMAFALLYTSLESYHPGSFQTNESDDSLFLYFSLVSLTTLGYGDIAPLTPQARVLCASEAVVGQFYIAVVVARLVSIQLATTQRANLRKQEKAKPNSPDVKL